MEQVKEFPTMPDWSKAPEWAQWFAIDSDGEGFFYDLKPFADENQWIIANSSSHICYHGNFDTTNWQNGLQKRPQ